MTMARARFHVRALGVLWLLAVLYSCCRVKATPRAEVSASVAEHQAAIIARERAILRAARGA